MSATQSTRRIMSIFLSVPSQYVDNGLTESKLDWRKYTLRADLAEWLSERTPFQFFMDWKYGAVLEIEDETVALQLKLAFDL